MNAGTLQGSLAGGPAGELEEDSLSPGGHKRQLLHPDLRGPLRTFASFAVKDLGWRCMTSS